MRFSFLEEAFNTAPSYVYGEESQIKTSETSSGGNGGNGMSCEAAFEHYRQCPLCKKYIDDIIEVRVQEKILEEANEGGTVDNNGMIILLTLLLILWIMTR